MSITSEENIDFDITQGDTWAETLQYVFEDEESEVVAPVDITGLTFKMEVRDMPQGRILCATCTIGDGITVIDTSNGLIDVEFTPEKTRNFIYPRAYYHIKSYSQSGEADTWMQGWFKVDLGEDN